MLARLARLCAALAALLPALAGAQVAAVDSLGREVRLEQPARRIVALAPHIVENVFSAGAGDRLVAAVSYSNYPPEARELPEVGSAFAWSLEEVAALSPDLVILWGSGNGVNGLAKLQRLGFPVYVSEPRNFSGIANSIRDIGRLAGSAAQADAAAAAFEQQIADLRRQYASGTALRAFYQIWNDPLQTINGEHLISQVIALCGGENVFAALPTLAPRINLEAVLGADPDVIIASGMDRSRPEWLDDWRRFPDLRAVRHNALVHINPDLIQRPTTRVAQGAADMCQRMQAVREAAPAGSQ
ncbi:cobalamin-binding protein [Haliea sp. E17]|uniref:cobalamin-binding protein n=1 Tax=Haliea sp. E17 TaxID=3401576 RepID=UPI003AAC52DF